MYYDEPIAENKYQFTIPAGYTDYVLCVPSGTWRVTIDADGFERWASDKDYVDYPVAAGVTVFTAPIDENEIQLNSTRLMAKADWDGNQPTGQLEVEVTPTDMDRVVTVTPLDPETGQPYENEVRFVPGNNFSYDINGHKFDYFALPDPVRGHGDVVLPEYRAIARYNARSSHNTKSALIFRHWAGVTEQNGMTVDHTYHPGDTVPASVIQQAGGCLYLNPVFYSVPNTSRGEIPIPADHQLGQLIVDINKYLHEELSEDSLPAYADANNDGSVTITDLVLWSQYTADQIAMGTETEGTEAGDPVGGR